MKPTKGPWTVQRSKKDFELYRILKPNLKEGLCIANTKADAHLIAAAPELLKALRVIVTECTDLTFDQLCLAKDALRKAEGSES